MANITAAMVKDLREKTGAGMMDCKKALTENGGDMDAATDWLRTKSLATVAKKASRVAAEGLVGVCSRGNKGAVVEVNSETDFVARNDSFQKMVIDISEIALAKDGDADAIASSEYPGTGKTVADHLAAMVATIGENMNLRRAQCLSVGTGVVASYVHNQTSPGLGRIGVLVALESTGDAAKLEAFGKQVAMHVAATSPLALTPEDLDPAVVERERSILAEQARESGKPEEIISKMVDGRMRKFYEESVLVSQTFVIDGENTVEKAVKAAEADVGAPIKLAGFVRFAIGEGIEKEESDFAAEVAATASGA
jgi:elongation factor Ts